MMQPLQELRQATDILLSALKRSDFDKAHEAISVMLMMGMNFFGPEHPFMQQCFPVWDRLQYLISVEDLEPALSQAKTWSRQLDEVIEIAERGEN